MDNLQIAEPDYPKMQLELNQHKQFDKFKNAKNLQELEL